MILVYHNITPPHYFIDVNHSLVQQCFSGRRELTAYIDRCDLALGDSPFNRAELDEIGYLSQAVDRETFEITNLTQTLANSEKSRKSEVESLPSFKIF